MSNKNLTYGLIVVGIIAIFGLFTPTGKAVVKQFGGVTNYDELDATAIKIGGSNGSRYSLVASGTCVLTSNSSIAATSTGQGTCATTGSLAGDIVYLNLATTTTVLSKQFVLLPNTVAGTDTTTVTIVNLTGTSGTPAAVPTLGSTTQYQIFRTTSTVPGL